MINSMALKLCLMVGFVMAAAGEDMVRENQNLAVAVGSHGELEFFAPRGQYFPDVAKDDELIGRTTGHDANMDDGDGKYDGDEQLIEAPTPTPPISNTLVQDAGHASTASLAAAEELQAGDKTGAAMLGEEKTVDDTGGLEASRAMDEPIHMRPAQNVRYVNSDGSTRHATKLDFSPASMLVAMSAADANGYRKGKCTLPQGLDIAKLAEAGSALKDEHQLSVSQLMHQIASTNKTTNAFLWQHWGDSDMLILPPGGHSASADGQDYQECSGEIAREIWSGQTLLVPTPNSGKIINAFGKFFACQDHWVFTRLEMFLDTKPVAKFPFYDAFYLPVGDESSPIESSWVKAAKAGNRPVVLVGPKHLGSLHAMLKYQKHFEIPLPTKGCGDIDRLAPQMVEYSRKSFPDQSVLFVVAGALIGKGIAYRAFQELHDKDIMVDVGSSLDAFAGQMSRDYNHDLQAICKSSKTWMACEACKSACNGIRESEPCSC